MARVTVEDCILHIPNRFDLVVTAAQRAKQISSGVPLTLDRDNDKDAVVSLREIAEKTIDLKHIQEEVVLGFMKKTSFDTHDNGEEQSEAARRAIEEELAGSHHFVTDNSTQLPGSLSFVEDNVEVED